MMSKLMKCWCVGLALTTVSFPASAQVCEEDSLQTALQYLRRLSLDLRGRVPTVAEQEAVIANGGVSEAVIDEMLASEDFLHQVGRDHLSLLWSNLTNLPVANNTFRLIRDRRGIYYLPSAQRRITYRGTTTPCLDEPARFGPSGEILTTPDPNDPSVRREGWLEIEPYWAPGQTVRICAFDAQTNLQAPSANGQPTDCARSAQSAGCGCGPDLRFCQSPVDGTNTALTDSFANQLLGYAQAIVRDNRPYSDLVLGRDMPINGPIAFYLRFQTASGGLNLPAVPDQNHPLPDLPFTAQQEWTTVQRTGRHAGVLTMPAFLLKFASDRSRANRFYQAFLCQEFLSNEDVPPTSDPCHAEPDLTQRCGCKGCHLAVEPAAAYWGRWFEAGLIPLDEDRYPRVNPTCAGPQGARNQFCRLFYFTAADVTDQAAEGPYVGQLRAYVFADATREQNIDAGPEELARQAVDSGAFARCAAQRAWTNLLNRNPTPSDSKAIDQLAASFETNGQIYRSLVKEIVTSEAYVAAGRHESED